MIKVEPPPGSSISKRLISRSFNRSDNELRIGQSLVSELVERHGTPLFVYDADVVHRQWQLLRAALPEEIDIFYSMKANPNQLILRHLLARGAGLEIASAGELEQALAAGCLPGQIVFAGPGKTNDELSLALSVGVSAIHAESIGELYRISDVAKKLSRRAPIALRVNPISAVQGGAMRMGGKASPFGIDEEQLEEAVETMIRLPALRWKGFHFYSGTQILDASLLQRQYLHAIQVASRIADRHQRAIECLDFGGGLGVPYFDHDTDLNMEQLAAATTQLIAEAQQHWALKETQFIVEPGRFLVAESGVYITRVLDVKCSRGKTFVIVDGGMHHHLAASGNLGQTIKRNFPITVLNKLQERSDQGVDVVGCLCTPLDTLGRDVALPPVEPGDFIGIFQSGAYALSASPQHFLSHSPPVEVWISGLKEHVVRRRPDFQRTCWPDMSATAKNQVRSATHG